MRQKEDFFSFCKKQEMNDKGIENILKKISSLDKKTKLKYKIICTVNLNKNIYQENLLKSILTIFAIFISLIILNFDVSSTIDNIIDVRMSKWNESLKRENQEARNIIENIKSGNQKERVFKVFTYNENNKIWEFGATKSEIDYYNDNIDTNNETINNNELYQVQRYSPMYLLIVTMFLFMIPVICFLHHFANKIKYYKNLLVLFT